MAVQRLADIHRRLAAVAVASLALSACEPAATAEPTDEPTADGRLSGPDDADADYPPGCSELGVSTCTTPCQRDDDAAACLHLAEGYFAGVGVDRDPVRGMTMLRRSCELGFARGCGYLGAAIYRDDPRASRVQATKGCELGYGGACVWLVAHHLLERTPLDWAAAAPFIERGCKAEHGNACLLWGDLLRTGSGVTADLAAAKLAYRTACDLGETSACELAEHDPTTAVVHALANGDPAAQEVQRTREHGKFHIRVAMCVMPDGSTRVLGVEGAAPKLGKVVRTTVEGWRWAPTGVADPTCTTTKFEYDIN